MQDYPHSRLTGLTAIIEQMQSRIENRLHGGESPDAVRYGALNEISFIMGAPPYKSFSEKKSALTHGTKVYTPDKEERSPWGPAPDRLPRNVGNIIIRNDPDKNPVVQRILFRGSLNPKGRFKAPVKDETPLSPAEKIESIRQTIRNFYCELDICGQDASKQYTAIRVAIRSIEEILGLSRTPAALAR